MLILDINFFSAKQADYAFACMQFLYADLIGCDQLLLTHK